MATNRRPPNPITVAEVIELPAGTKEDPSWVNGDLTAVIDNVQPNDGRTDLFLTDPDNPGISIKATAFGDRDLTRFDGQVCKLSGSMARTEYNGRDQVTIFAKCQINLAGNGAGRRQERAPAASHNEGARREPKPAPHAVSTVNGQTVGMAMKEAIPLVALEGIKLDDPKFWPRVKQHASDIIRISQSLEKGHLNAPSWEKKAAPQPEPAEEPSEEVPF